MIELSQGAAYTTYDSLFRKRTAQMGAKNNNTAIACGAALLACHSLSQASALDLDLDLRTNPITAQETANDDTQLASGLEVALNNALVNVALKYKVQSRFDESGDSVDNGTSQRLGAQFNSSLVDELLRGETRIRAESVFIDGAEQYRHQFNPTYSRPVLGIATLDMGYRYGLEGTSAAAGENTSSAYEFGLKGSLPWLPMDWSGGYVTASKLDGSSSHITSIESFKLQSNYTVSPQMTVQLFTRLREEELAAGALETQTSELRYGAGVVWQPSSEYALDLKIDRQSLSATGEVSTLRTGTLSWFPEEGLKLSLKYGDQLVEGARGLMFRTAFDLDRFWNLGR